MGRIRAAVVSALALGAALTLSAAGPAAAQNFFWLLPGGGEVWTAGTTHTIEWTGGPPGNANLRLIRLSPLQDTGIFAVIPNTGVAQWTIPANLTPGSYQLKIEDTAVSTWSYGYQVDINAPPACAANCVLTTVAMPFSNPPAGVCGANGVELTALAQAWAQSHFACPNGYEVDPGSMTIDVTFMPVGVCLAGYGGPFVAEAAAIACCCPSTTGAKTPTWGRLKSIYR
jgi:hypothetical protein